MKNLIWTDTDDHTPEKTGWYMVMNKYADHINDMIWLDWFDTELGRWYNPREDSDYTYLITHYTNIPKL